MPKNSICKHIQEICDSEHFREAIPLRTYGSNQGKKPKTEKKSSEESFETAKRLTSHHFANQEITKTQNRFPMMEMPPNEMPPSYNDGISFNPQTSMPFNPMMSPPINQMNQMSPQMNPQMDQNDQGEDSLTRFSQFEFQPNMMPFNPMMSPPINQMNQMSPQMNQMSPQMDQMDQMQMMQMMNQMMMNNPQNMMQMNQMNSFNPQMNNSFFDPNVVVNNNNTLSRSLTAPVKLESSNLSISQPISNQQNKESDENSLYPKIHKPLPEKNLNQPIQPNLPQKTPPPLPQRIPSVNYDNPPLLPPRVPNPLDNNLNPPLDRSLRVTQVFDPLNIQRDNASSFDPQLEPLTFRPSIHNNLIGIQKNHFFFKFTFFL